MSNCIEIQERETLYLIVKRMDIRDTQKQGVDPAKALFSLLPWFAANVPMKMKLTHVLTANPTFALTISCHI